MKSYCWPSGTNVMMSFGRSRDSQAWKVILSIKSRQLPSLSGPGSRAGKVDLLRDRARQVGRVHNHSSVSGRQFATLFSTFIVPYFCFCAQSAYSLLRILLLRSYHASCGPRGEHSIRLRFLYCQTTVRRPALGNYRTRTQSVARQLPGK